MKTIAAAGRRLAIVLAVGVLSCSASWAQGAFPTKPIRLIVPFPPGGGTDLIARTVSQKLTENLKWTVIIDNRPGAGGNLGVDSAAKSTPDGYTLVLGQTSNLAINPTLYSHLPYDPLKDLAPVVLVSSSPIAMAVGAQSRFKSFADLVAAAKAKPNTVTVGYSGNGTVSHLAVELAGNAAGIKVTHVPYKGAAQAMTDVMSGQIDVYMSSVPTLLPHVRSGKLRAIAVTSVKRSGEMPETPSLAEQGLPRFDAVTWFGIVAPAGTPPEIIRTLNTEINKVLRLADVAAKLRSDGGDVIGGTPEQFGALLQAEIPRWGQIVKDSGATID